MNKSLGLIEVRGLSAAYYALDNMLKTADVAYVSSEKNLGAGLTTIIIDGDISAVKTAIKEGKEKAEKINYLLNATTIDNPHNEIKSFIYHRKEKTKDMTLSKNMAIGFIEIFGYAASLVAADTALKSSNVSLLGIDKTKGKKNTPGLIMFLKLGGNIDDVKIAVNNALDVAKNMSGYISHTVIPHPNEMINRSIKEGI